MDSSEVIKRANTTGGHSPRDRGAHRWSLQAHHHRGALECHRDDNRGGAVIADDIGL